MKIRWTEESLRLRITPPELAALRAGREVATRLVRPGGAWGVTLAADGHAMSLAWRDADVRVTLAPSDVERLGRDDVEGVYAALDGLRLLVEKDFPCAHPHAPEAREPHTERFAPTPAFVERKAHSG